MESFVQKTYEVCDILEYFCAGIIVSGIQDRTGVRLCIIIVKQVPDEGNHLAYVMRSNSSTGSCTT
jgi:hypothetical protein